jgi:hypothetical protein
LPIIFLPFSASPESLISLLMLKTQAVKTQPIGR